MFLLWLLSFLSAFPVVVQLPVTSRAVNLFSAICYHTACQQLKSPPDQQLTELYCVTLAQLEVQLSRATVEKKKYFISESLLSQIFDEQPFQNFESIVRPAKFKIIIAFIDAIGCFERQSIH